MTKKTIARSPKRTKRAAEHPVDPAEIRRAAERAGVLNAETGLFPEEQASIDQLRGHGIPVSTFGLALVKELRSNGLLSSTNIARELRHEASDLEYLAERLTPEPEARDAMLKDALAVLEVAESIFEHRGATGHDLLGEALRCAEDDLELFEAANGSESGGPTDMAYLRAQYRIRLALKLAEFRAKHPSWKPTRAENEAEKAAGGAS